MTPTRRTPLALAAAAAVALSAGCGADDGTAASGKEETPHGYIEGAEETAEPQWRLVMADGESGGVHVLDPATEKVADAGTVRGVRSAVGDGRFAYFATEDAAHVIDSGTWTVDHGDHVHYYRTEMRPIGAVEGAPTAVASDTAATVLTSGGGVRVLDRSRMEDGKVGGGATVEGASALPVGGRVVVATDKGGVGVHGRDGAPESTLDDTCPDPARQALTRRGAVFGCSDGALVVSEDDTDDTALTSEKIPYPEDADPEPDADFRHRPGSPVLTAKAGDEGFWVLDVAAEKWTLVETRPVVAVSAVGEDSPLLALTDDGVLRSYDPETGEETARTELIEDPGGDGPDPAIQVDTGRAYVNDPAAKAVHEIDYNDDLRLARTFDLDFRPDHMVETGW